mgnify:CR=1 FL=1
MRAVQERKDEGDARRPARSEEDAGKNSRSMPVKDARSQACGGEDAGRAEEERHA